MSECEYAWTCISQDLTSVAAVSWYSGGFPLFFSLPYFLEVTQASQPDRTEGGRQSKKIRCTYPCSDTESETDLCEFFV